eukprot:58026-Chlamydomonas_euryale.AAC.10
MPVVHMSAVHPLSAVRLSGDSWYSALVCIQATSPLPSKASWVMRSSTSGTALGGLCTCVRMREADNKRREASKDWAWSDNGDLEEAGGGRIQIP